MIIKRIQNGTRVFGAPADWDGKDTTCGALVIRDVQTTEGNFMVSAWEPTPEEIERLQGGETVKLWIRGVAHPVVSLTVGDIA